MASDLALVLRRGPSRQVASLLWNRKTGDVQLGQWLKGRIYEHRSDLSPDGRHMIVFAGTGTKWWTAISRAPYFRALTYIPQSHTWHGGGAFTRDGSVFFNGFHGPDDLPDGLRRADQTAFPHGTDGFHMGGLYAARIALRGWVDRGGEGYHMVLEKPLNDRWLLRQTVEQGARDRGLVSTSCALVNTDTQAASEPSWEWAEPWKRGVQFAQEGALWFASLGKDGLEEPALIHDFSDMEFENRTAPYEGIRA